MQDNIQTSISWPTVMLHYFSDHWLWLIICIVALILLGRKAFDYKTIEPKYWRMAFGIVIIIAVVSNLYLVEQTYQDLQNQTGTQLTFPRTVQ